MIDEITPYYKPERTREFQKIFKSNSYGKRQGFKNSVKSFDVAIIESKDPAKQLYVTTTEVARELEGLLDSERGLKVYVTLHITFKKR